MSNDFENRTWRLSYVRPVLNNPWGPGYTIDPGLTHVATASPYATFRPVRSNTTLKFHFTGEDVTIEFMEASDYIKTIWRNVEGAYYEPAFNAIRGNVFDLASDGSPNEAIGLHFVFNYAGRAGAKRQLAFKTLDLSAESDSTLVVTSESTNGGSGSWKADED
ncbi:MAG: hypothetical protein AAGA23_16925 [Pseudomonadota bacterium]